MTLSLAPERNQWQFVDLWEGKTVCVVNNINKYPFWKVQVIVMYSVSDCIGEVALFLVYIGLSV